MYELYSRRNRNPKEEPEIYEYDIFPTPFRNQLFFILSDILDLFERAGEHGIWKELHISFSRELGVKGMGRPFSSTETQIEEFISKSSNQDLLDFMDYAFSFLSRYRTVLIRFLLPTEQNNKIDAAISELNYRLKQHNLGYEFVNGEIVRKDNEYLHQTVIKPALKLLYDAGFAGAEQEFLEAFEHRRKGENKDAILDALKAFESTMKAICEGLNYQYDAEKNTAKDLIQILETNGFYPPYLNSHMTSLRTSLESGLPTLRNKKAGHGQGEQVVNVSDEFTEYALNLAATNIVLLAKIYLAKKSGGQL